jgi:hypothetical protein
MEYKPPPTIREFILDYRPHQLFYDWIVGPVGSGKTTGIFFKLVRMAALQEPDADGIKRTRAVVVRNTAPQLRDTTLVSWNLWFQDGVAGRWRATDKIFDLKVGNIECEVLFRPLDTPADIARVLSLEVSFALLDEFVKIPRDIVDALSARLGRYPRNCTNWGMWGSSNPDTEDNWWFDHLFRDPAIMVMPLINALHYGDEDAWAAYIALEGIDLTQCNGKFFQQPSGFSESAENLFNLPPRDGSADYYHEIVKGKPNEWIKQFVDAEWGYSAEGRPVVPTFRPGDHVARDLKYNPGQPLIVGLDPGLGGSAFVFGQEDLHGRLLVLAELVQSGYGSQRLITERLKPFLRANFPNAQVIIAPDPAAGNRNPNDETEIIAPFKDPRHGFTVDIETNNRLPLRLDAIESFTMKMTGAGPGLAIDEQRCPMLIRALKGGWRYTLDMKRMEPRAEPEKNPWSHVGDGFGYLARYFHRANERYARYNTSGPGGRGLIIPRTWGSPYHFR